jgi:hypothetical protein
MRGGPQATTPFDPDHARDYRVLAENEIVSTSVVGAAAKALLDLLG